MPMNAVITQPANRLKENLYSAFSQAFARTETIFDLLTPEAYTQRPIALRHPINFYEGHLPAFLWNTLFGRTLNQPACHPEFDRLFERGIDPGTTQDAQAATIATWPSRDAVWTYKATIHTRFFDWLETVNLETPTAPAADLKQVLFLILEHELMHQETLLYMLHQLPHAMKKRPMALQSLPNEVYSQAPPSPHLDPLLKRNAQTNQIHISAGETQLGAEPGAHNFIWDNETPSLRLSVPAFAMDAHKVTNGDFLNFMTAGGYQTQALWRPAAWEWLQQRGQAHPQFWQPGPEGWLWRGFFEEHPLPLEWPVYVTQAEAEAYAAWQGMALPTEAEWQRAADHAHPSTDDTVMLTETKKQRPSDYAVAATDDLAQVCPPAGNWGFTHWSPQPEGRDANRAASGGSSQGFANASPSPSHACGSHQNLWGNGWEWTATPFQPFPGFQASSAYPQYSADFFDGQHFVVKGASCFTDQRLLRPSFRNWYYWHYPYAYIGFRCVKRD